MVGRKMTLNPLYKHKYRKRLLPPAVFGVPKAGIPMIPSGSRELVVPVFARDSHPRGSNPHRKVKMPDSIFLSGILASPRPEPQWFRQARGNLWFPSSHGIFTQGVQIPSVDINFQAGCFTWLGNWRPQGDLNHCYQDENLVSSADLDDGDAIFFCPALTATSSC